MGLFDAMMESEEITVPAEKQIELLRKFQEQTSRPCPFKVGDLVTQDEELHRYTRPSPGNPALVVEVYDITRSDYRGRPSDVCDMGIVALTENEGNGDPRRYEVESFRFVPYKEPKKK